MGGTGIMATVKRLTCLAHSVSIAFAPVNAEFVTYSVLCAGGATMGPKAELVGNRSPRALNPPPGAAVRPLKSLSLAITLGKTPVPVDGWMTTISSD